MSAHNIVPTAVRICEHCGELAGGDVCESCQSIERGAGEFAAAMILAGAGSLSRLKLVPKTKAGRLFVDLADKRFREIAESRKAAAAAAEDPVELAGVHHGGADDVIDEFVEVASRGARGLRNIVWMAAALYVFYFVGWQFRDYIVDCFDLWFGR